MSCFFSHAVFGLYIDELEMFLDEIIGNSPCLFNTMVVVLFQVDNVVVLSLIRNMLTKTFEQSIWILHFFLALMSTYLRPKS